MGRGTAGIPRNGRRYHWSKIRPWIQQWCSVHATDNRRCTDVTPTVHLVFSKSFSSHGWPQMTYSTACRFGGYSDVVQTLAHWIPSFRCWWFDGVIPNTFVLYHVTRIADRQCAILVSPSSIKHKVSCSLPTWYWSEFFTNFGGCV